MGTFVFARRRRTLLPPPLPRFPGVVPQRGGATFLFSSSYWLRALDTMWKACPAAWGPTAPWSGPNARSDLFDCYWCEPAHICCCFVVFAHAHGYSWGLLSSSMLPPPVISINLSIMISVTILLMISVLKREREKE